MLTYIIMADRVSITWILTLLYRMRLQRLSGVNIVRRMDALTGIGKKSYLFTHKRHNRNIW